MRLIIVVLLAGFSAFSGAQTPVKQGKPVPVNFCIPGTVVELYNRINEYRSQNQLPAIQLSRSLCYVAALHVKDLTLHHPDQGPCNFHSWSASGPWKPFCYPKDENKKNSVWDRPRELTRYPAKAYEIVYWQNTPLVADTVLMVWQTEEYFNSFLLNTGKWLDRQWNAIGIAMGENYACAWFGDAPDPDGTPRVCGMPVAEPPKDTIKSAPVVKAPLPPAKKPKTPRSKPAKTDTTAIKPVIPAPVPTTDTAVARPPAANAPGDSTIIKNWCIIVKTNLTLEAANNLVANLQAKDFPMARVITRDDKIRVSVYETMVKAEAMTKLKEVKRIYRDAWLYRY